LLGIGQLGNGFFIVISAHDFVHAFESFMLVQDFTDHHFHLLEGFHVTVDVDWTSGLALNANIGHFNLLHTAHVLQHFECLSVLADNERKTLIMNRHAESIWILFSFVDDAGYDIFGFLGVILMNFKYFFLLFL